MTRVRKVLRDGKWQEGASAPLLPEPLRKLPSSFVTRDTSDPDKIHELDPPHIVEALVAEQQKAEQAQAPAEEVTEKYDLWNGPLDQLHVDLVKLKVCRNLINAALVFHQRGAEFPLKKRRYLWFPENALSPRELREGPVPPRSERPLHLRNLDLVVDPQNLPPRIIDMLKAKNAPLPTEMPQ